ncbi:MAG: hypothetical protein AAF086_08025 [Planctomycetota bacterium]
MDIRPLGVLLILNIEKDENIYSVGVKLKKELLLTLDQSIHNNIVLADNKARFFLGGNILLLFLAGIPLKDYGLSFAGISALAAIIISFFAVFFLSTVVMPRGDKKGKQFLDAVDFFYENPLRAVRRLWCIGYCCEELRRKCINQDETQNTNPRHLLDLDPSQIAGLKNWRCLRRLCGESDNSDLVKNALYRLVYSRSKTNVAKYRALRWGIFTTFASWPFALMAIKTVTES